VTGTLQRYATRLANPDNGHVDFDTGVAELRSVTTDPHLLAHGTPASDEWWREDGDRLLLAAGADPAAMAQARADHDRRRATPDLIAQLADQLDTLPRT
jgi:hypothetical protein